MSKAPIADRPYESLFICPIETPQQTIDGFMEKVKAIVAKENGTFRGVQVWGRRRMMFPINRHKDGLYVYFDFNSGGGAPAALNSLYHVSDFVLRHLVVEREDVEIPVTPSAEAVGEKATTPAAGTPTIEKDLPSEPKEA